MRGGGVGAEGGIGSGGEVFCLMQFFTSIDHGGRRLPTAAMWPHSQRRSMQQSANKLGNRLASLKLEKLSLIMLVSPRHNALANHRAQCSPIAMAMPPMPMQSIAQIRCICLPSWPE
jgi:hypothetical protein